MELPTLYEFETPPEFTSRVDYWNGLGICSLRDTLECTVLENLDGVFELTMTYPDKGWKSHEIKIGRVLKVRTRMTMTPDEETKYKEPGSNGNWTGAFYHRLGWDYQPFYINDIDYDLSGVMTIKAVHYTYRLKETSLDLFAYSVPDYKVKVQGYLPSDFLDHSSLKGYFFDGTLWTWRSVTWYDRNGAVAPTTENIKRATYGRVDIYQNINNFLTPPPWMPPSTLIPNYYVRTLEYGKDNLSNIVLGDTDSSFKNQWKLEILRDRWCIIMTDKRSLKSWDDAYTLKYSRDLVGLKVKTDLSDIVTDCFPYYNFTGKNVADTNNDSQISREVNYLNHPTWNNGHRRIIDYKKDMRTSIAVDMTPWMDQDKIRRDLEPHMLSNGTWGAGAQSAGYAALTDAFTKFQARTTICFGTLTADVDFIPLWDTQESRHKKALQILRLGDPVIIEHDRLGNVYSKVTETVYNVLTGRYDSIKIESDSVVIPT